MGPVQLAQVKQILGLTVAGANLYWVDGQSKGGKIETVPVTGGTPKTVLASDHLTGDLATDGTRLYYLALVPSPQPMMCPQGLGPCIYELDAVGFDGTGQTQITQFAAGTAHASPASELFVVGANAYFGGVANFGDLPPSVMTVPLTGGTPTYAVGGLPSLPNSEVGFVVDLMRVDASGIYFLYNDTLQTQAFGNVPIAGGTVATLAHPAGNPAYPESWAGAFTTVGGTAYWVENIAGTPTPPFAGALMKAAPPSGPGSKVGATVGENAGLIADAKGAYLLENGAGEAGIFAIDLGTAAVTPFVSGALAAPSDQITALDAQNLYFATPGYTLWAMPR